MLVPPRGYSSDQPPESSDGQRSEQESERPHHEHPFESEDPPRRRRSHESQRSSHSNSLCSAEGSEVKTAFITAAADDTSRSMSMRTRLRRVMRSHAFEFCISVVIFFNFILTCMDTDAQADGGEVAPAVKHLMTACFVCVILEFALWVFVDRLAFFLSQWAWLDVFVIVSGFAEYAIQWSQADLGGVTIIRLLRVIRLFRLVRIVRHLSPFRELMKLVQMMGSCFRTLFWSFLLMGFVITIWGTIAVELLHPYVIELVEDHGEWADCERCQRSFASVYRADITLFQTIIAGDNWGQMALPIIDFKPWTAVIFVGALLTLVFGVMNLLVAVVLEVSCEMRAKDIVGRGNKIEHEEVEEKRALARIFHKIDTDKNGLLSYAELQVGARRVAEFRHWLRVLDIDSKDLLQLFQMCDADGSGEIDLDEFIDAMYRMKNTEPRTATRFVKHLVTEISKSQAAFERKVEGSLGACAEICGVETANELGERGTLRTPLHAEEELKQLQRRLDRQTESMEAAFQQAAREALEVALCAAADTSRHILQAAAAAGLRAAAPPEVGPPEAAAAALGSPRGRRSPPGSPVHAAAADEAADAGGFLPKSCWAESLTPRTCVSLPSEWSAVEAPHG